jgi:hypothetical protein
LTQINVTPAAVVYTMCMDPLFCPGARLLRQPKPELFQCPACGAEVEIWSDELRGTCPSCRRTVFRDGALSCLEWCAHGRECVGQESYDRYQRNRTAGIKRKLLELLDRRHGPQGGEVRRAREVLGWAERILAREKADWHIVLPASILLGMDREAAREALLRQGLALEDVQRVCRIIAGWREAGASADAELAVLHDACLLAGVEEEKPEKGAFLTPTAGRLSREKGPTARNGGRR